VDLAEEIGAMVYVDDAHGEGVLGEGGRGIVSHYGLDHTRVHVEMGTFSKAYGVVGGHISGSQDLVDFAYNKSRTWLLTGSHPPAVAAACTAAIEVLAEEPRHVRTLWENTEYFKEALQDLGFDTGKSETPITPVMVGESSLAKKLSDALYQRNIFALPIVYPMVARGQARIRTQMRSDLDREDLDYAVEAFEETGTQLGVV
jgi:glycine C-acetyltransferase